MDVETLGEFVKRLRTAKGLSQAALGRLIHVDGQTISNLESGRTRTLKLKNLVGLPAALGTTMEELQRVSEGIDSDTVTIVLPRAMYDSIMERVAYEGHKDILDFLGKVAVTHSFVIEMPEPPAPGTNRLNSPAPATPGPGGTAAARRRPTKARG